MEQMVAEKIQQFSCKFYVPRLGARWLALAITRNAAAPLASAEHRLLQKPPKGCSGTSSEKCPAHVESREKENTHAFDLPLRHRRVCGDDHPV